MREDLRTFSVEFETKDIVNIDGEPPCLNSEKEEKSKSPPMATAAVTAPPPPRSPFMSTRHVNPTVLEQYRLHSSITSKSTRIKWR